MALALLDLNLLWLEAPVGFGPMSEKELDLDRCCRDWSRADGSRGTMELACIW